MVFGKCSVNKNGAVADPHRDRVAGPGCPIRPARHMSLSRGCSGCAGYFARWTTVQDRTMDGGLRRACFVVVVVVLGRD